MRLFYGATRQQKYREAAAVVGDERHWDAQTQRPSPGHWSAVRITQPPWQHRSLIYAPPKSFNLSKTYGTTLRPNRARCRFTTGKGRNWLTENRTWQKIRGRDWLGKR